MDTTNFNNQVTQKAMETVEFARNQIPVPGSEPVNNKESKELMRERPETEVKTEKQEYVQEMPKDDIVLGDSNDVTSAFGSLPIEHLICAPIIAAAKGQQELTSLYVDNLMQLAYAKDESGKIDREKTNILKFKMQCPVDNGQGAICMEECEIQAPLISLVPVPAFTMDELTVDFSMEVKASEMREDKSHADVTAQAGYKSVFGFSTSITGNVSSDSMHKRETDSSATYNIHARAVQQPPSEGMAKLTALFSQMMEPISSSGSSK